MESKYVCDLPYADDALEPHMSKETVINHRKHHTKYGENLHKLLRAIGLEENLPTLLRRFKNTNQQTLVWDPIYNNAAQVHNHNLFFLQFNPDRKKHRITNETLSTIIKHRYGSIGELKKQVKQTVKGFFGSGWVWVTLEHTKQWDAPSIRIRKTPNGGTFVNSETDPHFIEPLIVVDAWEHAYYLQYKQDKGSYVDAIWKLIDWERIEQRFEAAMAGTFDYTQPFEH